MERKTGLRHLATVQAIRHLERRPYFIHENMGLAVQQDCVNLLPIELILQRANPCIDAVSCRFQ